MAITTHASGISDLQHYRKKREQFYKRFGAEWPGTLLDPYDILEVHPLPRADITAIIQASEAIARVYQRTAALLRTLPEEALLQMGLPKPALDLARGQIPGMPDTVIGRLDLVKTGDGYKLLEFNADAPGLMVEAFAVNAKVCQESGKVDPNSDGEAALAAALRDAVRAGLEYVDVEHARQGSVVFTSCSTYVRERDVAHYLMRLLDMDRDLRKQYVPMESLRGDANGLYDPDGGRIDVLYRTYPFQFFSGGMFSDDQDENAGLHDGQLLYELIKRRKLAVINPPSAFLLESKAVQVVIWGLCEAGLYFDAEERTLIRRHFLPTFLDPVFQDEPYVVKPVYGAEGDTVTIVNPRQGTTVSHNGRTYDDQTMIYQKYAELPLIETMTEDGPRPLRMLISCFLIAGQAIGVCARAGHGITDASWWVAPVCVAD